MSFPFCFAALLYAITGGPSVGKTSIINELEKQGEFVIQESASDYISDQLRLGVLEFWKEEEFGLNILKMQLKREEPFLHQSGRVFVDRGVFDNHAYAMRSSLAGTQTLASMNAALENIDLNARYKAIFLVLPFKDDNFKPVSTEIRHENTLEEVREIQAALYAIYSMHENLFIVPGNLSPQERASFILEHVKKIEGELQ